MSVGIPALVKGNDSDWVPSHEIPVLLCIVECEGEDSVQHVEESVAILDVQRDEDLAVRLRLELVFVCKRLPELLVVVDFAVDGEDVASVGAVEGLLARQRVNDCQAFMGDERLVALEDAGPVRSAVANPPRHLE